MLNLRSRCANDSYPEFNRGCGTFTKLATRYPGCILQLPKATSHWLHVCNCLKRSIRWLHVCNCPKRTNTTPLDAPTWLLCLLPYPPHHTCPLTHLTLCGTTTDAAASATCLAVTLGLKPLTATTPAPSTSVDLANDSSSGRLDPKP